MLLKHGIKEQESDKMNREDHIKQLITYLRGYSFCMVPASSDYWREHYKEIELMLNNIFPIKALPRCKDCKYWSNNKESYLKPERCTKFGIDEVYGSDYCSRAERKEK